MNNLYRLNRIKGLKSATIFIDDLVVNLTVQTSVPDESYKGEGDLPMVSSEPVSLSFSLAEISSLPCFESGAMLVFDVASLTSESPYSLKNIFVDTYVGRKPIVDVLYEQKINAAIRILAPSRHITSLKQCKWLFCMADSSCVLEANLDVFEIDTPAQFLAAQFRPVISGPSTISAGGSGNFDVQLQSSEGDAISLPSDIYLEATAGNLSRARVTLSDAGVGSFVVFAAGLQPGDKIKLKSGFRYFPGAFEKIVDVV